MSLNRSTDDDFTKESAPEPLPHLMESLTKMASLAFWPIAGYMFHPTYLITNAATCDRLGS
jgi:hypothetical protein